MQKVTPDYGAR